MVEIEKSFQQLGSQIKENIPHVKVGGDRPINDPFVEKFRKWALMILSFLIGGGAAILIIRSLFRKFF